MDTVPTDSLPTEPLNIKPVTPVRTYLTKNIVSLLVLPFFVLTLGLGTYFTMRGINSEKSMAAIVSKTVTGKLQINTVEKVTTTNIYYINYTVNGTPTTTQFTYKGAVKLIPGNTYRVTGVVGANKVLVASSVTNVTVVKPTPTAASTRTLVKQTALAQSSLALTSGTKKIAVILLNWSDLTTATPSRAQVLDLFNGVGKIHDIYSENSFNTLNISVADADIYGWYNTNVSSTVNGQTACNNFMQVSDNSWLTPDPIVNWVNANVPVNLANYQHVMYVLPTTPGCAGGISPIGYEGYGLLWSVINAANFDLKTVPHELGHNFGAGHASTLSCPSGIPSSCTGFVEYGDLYDPMGWNNNGTFHFTGYNKNLFGWLAPANVKQVNLSESGTYVLSPIEKPTATGIQYLRVDRDANSYYLLENRINYGLDTNLPSNITNGLMIRISNFNPAVYVNTNTLLLGTYGYGQIFDDTTAGLKITPLSKNGELLSVKVERTILGPSPSPTPTRSPTPTPSPLPTKSPTPPPTPGGPITQTYSLISSADDATSAVGDFRFRNVQIPRYAKINSAVLKLTPNANFASTTYARNYWFMVGLPASSVFSNAKVWTLGSWTTDTQVTSVDVAAELEDALDWTNKYNLSSPWVQGGDIAFRIGYGDSSIAPDLRTWYSYTGNPAKSAKLVVTFTPATVIPTPVPTSVPPPVGTLLYPMIQLPLGSTVYTSDSMSCTSSSGTQFSDSLATRLTLGGTDARCTNAPVVQLSFGGIQVAKGTVISDAYLEITPDANYSSATPWILNASADTLGGNNPSLTQGNWSANTVVRINLKDSIQRTLNASYWTEGGTLGVILRYISGTGARSFYSFEGDPTKAAKLIIKL